MPAKDMDFQIGLAMSGAISAGAYTAGVFDFLIQALDAWEAARNGADRDKIPNHNVGIKVMTGASAGAITAAIGAIALVDEGQKPGSYTDGSGQVFEFYFQKLYETWVVKPTLMAEDAGATDFLSCTDLGEPPPDDFSHTSNVTPTPTTEAETKAQPVTSLLNSRLLNEIARAAINVQNVRPPRPYVANPLHIYMTLSNLRGVPYEISFKGGADYYMISHGDRVHYAISGVGSWPSQSPFADNDNPRAIEPNTLPAADANWKDFSICALASAAFPVGLAPRLIGANFDEYKGRRFPLDNIVKCSDKISPDWDRQLGPSPQKCFSFVTADGGIIDNDPFEYARFTIKENLSEPNERDLAKADRAVIMISPFPERKLIKPAGQPAIDLVSIFAALQPALIEQARFKPGELALAADPTVGSRYLIGPRRVDDGREKPTEEEKLYPLASGLLGGFGGFVARAFRDHDFQLGRRNCQKFLRDVLSAPPPDPDHADHAEPIFQHWPEAARTSSDFKSTTHPNEYSIVPLLGSAAKEVPLPKWPSITQQHFDQLQNRIAQRFDYLAPALVAQNFKGLLRWLIRFATVRCIWPSGLIRQRILYYAKWAILSDLVRRDQIDGWSLPASSAASPVEIRLVLGELLNPAFDLRRVSGLVKTTGLSEDKVRAILDFGQSAAAKGRPFQVWRAPRTELYTLKMRKPSITELLALTPLRAILPNLTVDPAEA